MSEVRKVWLLATRHLRPSTLKSLDQTIPPPIEGAYYGDKGLFIKVIPPNEHEIDDLDDLFSVMTVAKLLNYDFLLFHPSNPIERQYLRTYRDEEPTS